MTPVFYSLPPRVAANAAKGMAGKNPLPQPEDPKAPNHIAPRAKREGQPSHHMLKILNMHRQFKLYI